MIKAEIAPRELQGSGVLITIYSKGYNYPTKQYILDWNEAEDLFHELDRLLTQRVNSIATQAADIPSSPEAENTE